jgi:hypothetical protein
MRKGLIMLATDTKETLKRLSLPGDYVEDLHEVVAREYAGVAGRMEIKPLWSRDNVHYVRVNWWLPDPVMGNRVSRSAFVAVEQTDDGLAVRDAELSLAA